PPETNIVQKNSTSTADAETSWVAKARGNPSAVSNAKNATGRCDAQRSAAQPQKKYPISQPSGGIHSTLPKSDWVRPSTRFKYKGARYSIGPIAMAPRP